MQKYRIALIQAKAEILEILESTEDQQLSFLLVNHLEAIEKMLLSSRAFEGEEIAIVIDEEGNTIQ